MGKTCKPFTEETLADALGLVEDRFGRAACAQTRRILANPLRKECTDAGTVGYRDGRPVCFQSAMLRRCYWRGGELRALVGGMTCKVKKGCPVSLLLETIDRASAPRAGSVLSFGNSCCSATADMNAENGGTVGPESCTRYLWRAIRPLDCLSYAVRRKVLKRGVPPWKPFSTLKTLDFSNGMGPWAIRRAAIDQLGFLDSLMSRYLDGCRGFVCSRREEDFVWMYGPRIESGEAVVLVAGKGDQASEGFIVVGSDAQARRWMVMDWFAVRNDADCLGALLRAACAFLKKHTPAMMLSASGFPTCIQPLLRKFLPHILTTGVNAFSWSAADERLETELKASLDTPESWFFGPYDGDLCMV